MRILSILHLCFVFSVVCWTLSIPFTEELYNDRTLKTAYHTVMGDEHLAHQFPEEKDKLAKFQSFFVHLPAAQQSEIHVGYAHLQEKISTSAWTKTKSACYLLFFGLPLFKRAWIFFSLILAVMALKERQGIRQAIWILPIVTFCYAGDQYFSENKIYPNAIEMLVPQEHELAEKYLGHPIQGEVAEQHSQLQQAWESYLVDVWAPRIGGDEELQLRRGEYAFAIARLNALESDFSSQKQYPQNSNSAFVLCCFLGWNLLYAWNISRIKN